jgi:3D (Asp-Asp-Asp) domain-containing protein
LSNKLALVSDRTSEKATEKAPSRALSEVRTEKEIGAAIVEPKVFLKNPSIEFKVNPSESKLNRLPFISPSMETLGAAASFNATAYALRGLTRSGVYVRRGVIAADPRVIPLGSVVQISTPGYCGVYTVHDTGKRIKGQMVDLWVESPREARIFGRRQVKVHVLRLGPKPSSNK